MELSFPTTLIIRPILNTIFDALFNYSYAVGVDGTIVVCLLSVRPSVRNGCIVDKCWVIEENFLHE